MTARPLKTAEPDLASPAFKAHPHEHFAMMRHTTPVQQMRLRNGAIAWLVTRYEDGVAVLADARFAKDPLKSNDEAGSKPPWLPRSLRALSRTMLDLDEPDHRRLRGVVQRAFTPRVVDALRPRIESIAAQLLETIEQRGRQRTVDLIAEYAAPIPVTVIAELLAVPERDRPRFHRWSNHIVQADTSMWHRIRAIPSAFAFIGLLRRLIRQRRLDIRDDLLSGLIQVQDNGDRLSADELLAMCFLLLIAGHETTVNLIGNGLLALLEHPEQMTRLRNEPALIAPAIEEMLRYGSPLQMTTERYATTDVEVGGVAIPRGALVYVVLASTNRDDETFADADRFDVARSPNRHLAFGHGIHYCLGAPLARLEGQIAIQLLLGRFGEIQLANQEMKELKWRRGLVLRGVESLPVRLSR
jgi:cytochrome P450